MSKTIYRQQTPRPHSTLSTMDVNTPPYVLERANTTEASEKPCTQSAKTANLASSTKISTGNTLPHISSENAAATLFKSTVLALLAAGLLKRGKDKHGNTVLVMPSTVWNNEMRLK